MPRTEGTDVKRTLLARLALPTSAAALALGAVACEVEDGGTDTGTEDPIDDDGTIEDGDL